MTAAADYDEDDEALGGVGLTGAQRRAWESVVDGGWRILTLVNQTTADLGYPSTPDLRVLDALGREPRMRISDIAAATHIQMSTVSRQISRLIEQEMVERVAEVDSDDARHRWVRPTEAGREYLDGLLRCRDQAVRKHVLDVLGEDGFLELGVLFAKLT